MSRTIKKHVSVNPITKTRTIRYEDTLLTQAGKAIGTGIPLTILAIAGFFGLMHKLTDGNDENYEAYCARRDAMPKKSAKVELTILGIMVIAFIALMWYTIATA